MTEDFTGSDLCRDDQAPAPYFNPRQDHGDKVGGDGRGRHKHIVGRTPHKDEDDRRIDRLRKDYPVRDDTHLLNPTEQEIRQKGGEDNPGIRKDEEHGILAEIPAEGATGGKEYRTEQRKQQLASDDAERDLSEHRFVAAPFGACLRRRQDEAELNQHREVLHDGIREHDRTISFRTENPRQVRERQQREHVAAYLHHIEEERVLRKDAFA